MSKTKTNFMKLAMGLLVIVFGLSACSVLGLGDTASLKVAKTAQKNATVLSSFTTGELVLNSSISYYEESISMAEEWIGNAESYSLTAEEVEGLEAWKTISQFLVDKLPDTTDSSTSDVDAAYVGTANSSTVYGIFVYHFKAGVNITEDVLEKANAVSDYTYENYFVKGDYIVTVEKEFLSGNGLSIDDIYTAFDAAIK